MNKMGVMRGNKETAKGKAMAKKHKLNDSAEKHFFKSKTSK